MRVCIGRHTVEVKTDDDAHVWNHDDVLVGLLDRDGREVPRGEKPGFVEVVTSRPAVRLYDAILGVLSAGAEVAARAVRTAHETGRAALIEHARGTLASVLHALRQRRDSMGAAPAVHAAIRACEAAVGDPAALVDAVHAAMRAALRDPWSVSDK